MYYSPPYTFHNNIIVSLPKRHTIQHQSPQYNYCKMFEGSKHCRQSSPLPSSVGRNNQVTTPTCTYPHTKPQCYGILSSELYEAKRWQDDPLYQAPMIVTDEGSQLFIGEIVEVLDDVMVKVCSHGKVIKFMTKVKKTAILPNAGYY